MAERTATDAGPGATAPPGGKPVVTLFEQYGAGATDIGMRVAEKLGLPFHAQAFSSDELEAGPEAALENRAQLATVLATMGGAYGGFEGHDVVTTQQEKRDLVTSNNRDVWNYAEDGGVIVGRNATVILAARPNTLHVLLTGEVNDRVARAATEAGISLDRAARRQSAEDAVRAEMSVVLYGWDPRLPDRYDLVLNTSRISPAAAAAAIVDALKADTP